MPTKVCSKCKVEKSLSDFWKSKKEKDGLQVRCKGCRSDSYNKEYQKKYRESRLEYFRMKSDKYKREHPERIKAHNDLKTAVRLGRIKRQPCEVCGEPEAEAHHKDYSRTLEVSWLCKKHHEEAHSKLPNP